MHCSWSGNIIKHSNRAAKYPISIVLATYTRITNSWQYVSYS